MKCSIMSFSTFLAPKIVNFWPLFMNTLKILISTLLCPKTGAGTCCCIHSVVGRHIMSGGKKCTNEA